MRKMKRLISSLLAVLMLVASLNITFVSAAETFTDLENDSVDKVMASGIMTGTDNGMELETVLTRAQAATIMIRLKGVSGKTGNLPNTTTKFTDVPESHWASGNITRAVDMGIVLGVSDTEFAPEREVTVAEVVTMAARALGAAPVINLSGTWPTNYMNFAYENDLVKNLDATSTQKATRLMKAIIAGNTLEANLWKNTGALGTDKEVSKTNDTILEDVLRYDWFRNVIVTGIDLKDRVVSGEYKEIKDVQVAGKFGYEAGTKIDLAGLTIGQEVDVWYDRTSAEIIRIGLPESTKRTIVHFDSIESFATDLSSVKLNVDGSIKEYSFATEGQIVENGKSSVEWNNNGTVAQQLTSAKLGVLYSKKINAAGRVVLDGNKVAVINGTVYENAIVVDRVSGETIYADSDALEVSGNSLNLKDKSYLIVDETSKEISIADVKAGDFVLYVGSGTTSTPYRLMVINNVEEGTVSVVGTTFARIGSSTYEIDQNILAPGNLDVEADDEVQLFLNAAGKIVAYKKVEGDVSTNYGIITYARGLSSKYASGNYSVELEVTYFDGTTTGVKELDVERTDKATAGANVAAWDITGNTYATGLANKLLGQTVKFRNGTKIEIQEVSTAISQLIDGGVTLTLDAAEDKLDSFTTANFDIDNNRITSSAGLKQTARIGSTTKLALIKAGTGTDASYKKNVEFVDWSSLKDKTYDSADKFVTISQNTSTGIIAGLTITLASGTLSRDYTANFGFVKAVSKADRNDYITVGLITPDGLKEYSIYSDDIPAGTTLSVGTMLEYSVSGSNLSDIKVIKEQNKAAGTTTANPYAYDRYQIERFNSNTIRLIGVTNTGAGAKQVIEVPITAGANATGNEITLSFNDGTVSGTIKATMPGSAQTPTQVATLLAAGTISASISGAYDVDTNGANLRLTRKTEDANRPTIVVSMDDNSTTVAINTTVTISTPGATPGHSVEANVVDASSNIIYIKSDSNWDRAIEGYQDEIDTISLNSAGTAVTTYGTDVKVYLTSDNEKDIAIIWYQR